MLLLLLSSYYVCPTKHFILGNKRDRRATGLAKTLYGFHHGPWQLWARASSQSIFRLASKPEARRVSFKLEIGNEMEETDLSQSLETTHLSQQSDNVDSESKPANPANSRIAPTPSSIPASISRSYSILGVHTDAWVQIFSDRIVVGVTQLNQKVGNWCLCQAEQSPVNPRAIDFNINTVLGDRNDAMLGVYARRITERIIESKMIPGSNYLAIFLGCSLKNKGTDREMFRLVVEVLVSLVQEALNR